MTFQEKISIQNTKPRNQLGNASRELSSQNNNNGRNQHLSQSARRDNFEGHRNGNKCSGVSNSHVQAGSIAANTQNCYEFSRNTCVPLPDVSRPPPPISFSMNQVTYSSSSNHLNW